MFIIFGIASKDLEGAVIKDVIACRNCNKKEHYVFGIVKYAYIFWIPIIPLSRMLYTTCSHCKLTLDEDELPIELVRDLKPHIFKKKSILPLFSGAVIIACMLCYGSYISTQIDIKELSYIEQPIKNDYYICNLNRVLDYSGNSEAKYGILRINKIDNKNVTFQSSKVTYNKVFGPNKDIRNGEAFSNEYYYDDLLVIKISQLVNMKKTGKIHSIERISK